MLLAVQDELSKCRLWSRWLSDCGTRTVVQKPILHISTIASLFPISLVSVVDLSDFAFENQIRFQILATTKPQYWLTVDDSLPPARIDAEEDLRRREHGDLPSLLIVLQPSCD